MVSTVEVEIFGFGKVQKVTLFCVKLAKMGHFEPNLSHFCDFFQQKNKKKKLFSIFCPQMDQNLFCATNLFP